MLSTWVLKAVCSPIGLELFLAAAQLPEEGQVVGEVGHELRVVLQALQCYGRVCCLFSNIAAEAI